MSGDENDDYDNPFGVSLSEKGDQNEQRRRKSPNISVKVEIPGV